MSGLKALRERISTVKATRKITSAMKMVAAAKLRRSQEITVGSRPYAIALEKMLAAAGNYASAADMPKILLPAPEKPRRCRFIVAAADRGLCGSFNSSIARQARQAIDQARAKGVDVRVLAIGRKVPDQLGREYRSLIEAHYPIQVQPPPEFSFALTIAEKLMESFHQGEFDTVDIFYAYFRSAISQIVRRRQVIPFPRQSAIDAAEPAPKAKDPQAVHAITTFEPEAEELFHSLLIHNLATQIYRALLENAASEHGARMSAMDNATRNAEDMIARLTLDYNRTRQTVITNELIEIISGAEAL